MSDFRTLNLAIEFHDLTENYRLRLLNACN